MKSNPPVWLAYTAAFFGVCSHASSEFFSKLSGLPGVETSVWRFMIGGAALLLVAMMSRETRQLLAPFKQDFWPIASAVQVATMVTIMPIGVVFVARIIEGTRVTPAKLVSGIGAFLGCMLLLTDGYLAQLGGDGDTFKGVLMALTCAVIGSVHICTWLFRTVVSGWLYVGQVGKSAYIDGQTNRAGRLNSRARGMEYLYRILAVVLGAVECSRRDLL